MKKKVIYFCFLCLFFVFCSTKTAKAEEPVAGINVCESITEVFQSSFNVMWTTTRLNLRSKPDINSELYTTIKKGSVVFFLDNANDEWAKIKYEGQEGYVKQKYLTDKKVSNTTLSHKEIELLQRITEAECTGYSIESKMNVASVIINRLSNDEFPDNIKDIIFQEDQFSPISDKRFFKVKITEDTIKAVDAVLTNGVTHKGLYFANLSRVKSKYIKKWFFSLDRLFTDDANHTFFI